MLTVGREDAGVAVLCAAKTGARARDDGRRADGDTRSDARSQPPGFFTSVLEHQLCTDPVTYPA